MSTLAASDAKRNRPILNELFDPGFIVIGRGKLASSFDHSSFCKNVRERLMDSWEHLGGDPKQLYIKRLPHDVLLLINGKPEKIDG